jgi:rifampicin phosphotransferase
VHARFSIPEHWRGNPEEVLAPEAAASQSTVEGEGVSAGVVTGTARVVLDPSSTDVEPDEVLVAPTTDPGWSAIMFVSKALIVDIGGELSHAAVVARELGIPCVVNTRNGTKAIQTGDRVRVDGGAGTIEILERAAEK